MTGVLELLLRSGATAALADKEGRIPLHWAAANENPAGLQLLLTEMLGNGDVTAVSRQDTEQMTPLHFAAFHNYAKNVQALVKGGANLRLADLEGKTALHWAAGSGDAACIKMLLLGDKTLASQADAKRCTPLHVAIGDSNAKGFKELLKSGGSALDVNAQDDFNRSPLHWAAAVGGADMATALLKKGANDSLQDK